LLDKLCDVSVRFVIPKGILPEEQSGLRETRWGLFDSSLHCVGVTAELVGKLAGIDAPPFVAHCEPPLAIAHSARCMMREAWRILLGEQPR
jgi:hypothetical protein